MKLNELIKKHLDTVVNESSRGGNYMFFSNLEQIKRQCELLMEIDESVLEDLLNNGHDWADNHITVAKENMDQVFDFIMNETKNEGDINEMEDNPCWKGYKMIGKKMKNGKEVPNCVPKK